MSELVQDLASGKAAMGVAAGSAVMPWWLHFIPGDAFQAIIAMLSILVSLSIIAINIQTFIQKYKGNKRK